MATANDTLGGKAAPAFTPEAEAALRESLRRCPPTAIEAACEFRRTQQPELIPTIVLGIIERFVEPDLRPRLREGSDELRVVEDLGVDSLTLMEIVVLVEEVLHISINNDELRGLRTVGDVKLFIDCKARGLPPPKPPRFLPNEEIGVIMPIQPPFLFLHEARVGASQSGATYKITGQEFFFQGHFKDNPVLPASIMVEALGQLAVLSLIAGEYADLPAPVDPTRILFTSCEGVRCSRICRPGDVLSLSVKLRRMKAPVAVFSGEIRVGSERAALVEDISLTFDMVKIAHDEIPGEVNGSAVSGSASTVRSSLPASDGVPPAVAARGAV